VLLSGRGDPEALPEVDLNGELREGADMGALRAAK
jgi:hypothetical protein